MISYIIEHCYLVNPSSFKWTTLVILCTCRFLIPSLLNIPLLHMNQWSSNSFTSYTIIHRISGASNSSLLNDTSYYIWLFASNFHFWIYLSQCCIIFSHQCSPLLITCILPSMFSFYIPSLHSMLPLLHHAHHSMLFTFTSCTSLNVVPFYFMHTTQCCSLLLHAHHSMLFPFTSCTSLNVVPFYFMHTTQCCSLLLHAHHSMLFPFTSCTPLNVVPFYFMHITQCCSIFILLVDGR